jgi:drug/metabolite transporter (DMT)-like permease
MTATQSGRGPITGYLLCAGAAILWGTWALWLRAARLPSGVVALVVMATLVVGGLPPALAVTRRQPRRPRLYWWGVVLCGLLDAANNVCFFAALGHGAVAQAVLTHYLAPVLVALSAPRLLAEPLGRRTPAAVGAALVGLLLLLEPWRAQAAPWAAFWGTASAVFYAGTMLSGKWLTEHFAAAELVPYHALPAAVVLAPLALPALGLASGRGLALIVVAALVLGLAAGVAFFAGLARIPAPHAGVLAYLEPLVAVLVGAAAFGERLSPLAAVGGLIIVAAGVAVVTEGTGK